MKSGEKTKENKRLSKDLTLVLIRGNGTPRSFRVPVPEVERSIFLLGTTVLLLSLATIGLLVLHFLRPALPVTHSNANTNYTNTSVATPVPAASSSANTTPVSAPVNTAISNDPNEQVKEIAGLREDNAKLHAELEERRTIPENSTEAHALLQFFPARSVPASQEDSQVAIENTRVVHHGDEVHLNFEIRNTDPAQRQIRGYIVVLAKSTNFLLAYPTGTFSPKENIVLNFTKGETFAISHGRAAEAIFSNVPKGSSLSFQVILFATSGKIITNLNVEDKK